jgi:hypothetical protein
MGELIELGKVQGEIIQSSKNELLVVRVINFLELYYGLICINVNIIQSAISQGGKTVEDLASFYLNWVLGKRLGDFRDVVRGKSTREVTEKFIGIQLFKNEGPGPLRWAIKRVNRGRFDNFQQAWEKINQDNNPGGGLYIIKNSTGKRFVFDPLSKKLKKGRFKISQCWAYRDGREFFLINNGEENFFIPDKGQSPSETLCGFLWGVRY